MAQAARRSTISASIVLACVLAACGGDDTASSADEGATGESAGAAAAGAGAESGAADGGIAPDGEMPDSTAGDSGESGDVDTVEPTEAAPALAEPPPDTDGMAPADGPPDHTSQLLRAFANVSVGGAAFEEVGVEPIWFTDMGPTGASAFTDGVLEYVAGCSILRTSDDQITAQVSFHHAEDRFEHSSFSMSDHGDGTVTWGLFDAASGEEWSATGPGEASISYVEFDDPFGWEALGFDADAEEILMIIDFAGEADENFSTDKAQASSRVICHFITRPD